MEKANLENTELLKNPKEEPHTKCKTSDELKRIESGTDYPDDMQICEFCVNWERNAMIKAPQFDNDGKFTGFEELCPCRASRVLLEDMNWSHMKRTVLYTYAEGSCFQYWDNCCFHRNKEWYNTIEKRDLEAHPPKRYIHDDERDEDYPVWR